MKHKIPDSSVSNGGMALGLGFDEVMRRVVRVKPEKKPRKRKPAKAKK